MDGIQIGIDVGGTFTDVVAVDAGGGLHYLKTPSTPDDQSEGVLAGLHAALERLSAEPGQVGRLAHGTTVATNALLERTGARTGLLVTAGFRDILHIGRQARPSLYDLNAARPAPLVRRRHRYEVSERTRHTGAIEEPLDADQLRTVVARLQADGIESLAICFLHAYVNPANERRAAELVRHLLPDLPVSVSSDILPEFREFERMNTTVINAYLQPVMARYITRLIDSVHTAGVQAPLLVMQSSGGMMTARTSAQRSVSTLLSGPAGGVLGAAHLANMAGHPNCITADVGGTSFDVATIVDGRPAMQTEGAIEGYPVKLPHIDIHTIGAGGGSIAWIDRGGALRVGPRSAGAVPGPVAYGLGGSVPTVTDAHAVLGRLGDGALMGGALRLDVNAAQAAIQARIAKPLGLALEEAAEGILRVVNAGMARAIRVMTVERGLDPRHFVLIPYGGAGPLHAVDLARQLDIARVLIPVAPGNFSAFGLLAAPVRYDAVRTYRERSEHIDLDQVNRIYAELKADVAARLVAEGFAPERCRFRRQVDMRYYGQAYELTVDAPEGTLHAEPWRTIEQQYHDAHAQVYGFAKEADPVELVNLRLSGFAELEAVTLQRRPDEASPTGAELTSRRPVFLQGRWTETAIYARDRLRPGQALAGPAIIQEAGSTTVVGESDRAVVDSLANLLITLGE